MAGIVNSSLASGSKTELGVDPLDTVGRVDVLDQGNLPACSATLTGSDRRGSQEVLPDLDRISTLHHIDLNEEKSLRGTISCRTWLRPFHGCPSSSGTNATR